MTCVRVKDMGDLGSHADAMISAFVRNRVHMSEEEINRSLNEMKRHICMNCRWRSDSFTSACVNADSPRCADFVAQDDTCEAFEVTDDG